MSVHNQVALFLIVKGLQLLLLIALINSQIFNAIFFHHKQNAFLEQEYAFGVVLAKTLQITAHQLGAQINSIVQMYHFNLHHVEKLNKINATICQKGNVILVYAPFKYSILRYVTKKNESALKIPQIDKHALILILHFASLLLVLDV